MNFKTLCIISWFANLIWLMLLVWGAEYLIQERGFEWIKEPQFFCICGACITKLVLSCVIAVQQNIIKTM